MERVFYTKKGLCKTKEKEIVDVNYNWCKMKLLINNEEMKMYSSSNENVKVESEEELRTMTTFMVNNVDMVNNVETGRTSFCNAFNFPVVVYANGGHWGWNGTDKVCGDELTVEEFMMKYDPSYKVAYDVESKSPIKSDGGSSTYYDIRLPNDLITLLVERRGEAGGSFIKTEELIEALGSDFDIGNILKCNVRINSLINGGGKEGNSVEYDANKIKYSANRLSERFSK